MGNTRFELDSLCDDTVARRAGETASCNSRLSRRLYDTVPGESGSWRYSQTKPELDSCGYVTIEECPGGAGKAKASTLGLPATTGYMPMARNPVNDNCDGIRVSKQCAAPNSTDMNTDRKQ